MFSFGQPDVAMLQQLQHVAIYFGSDSPSRRPGIRQLSDNSAGVMHVLSPVSARCCCSPPGASRFMKSVVPQ